MDIAERFDFDPFEQEQQLHMRASSGAETDHAHPHALERFRRGHHCGNPEGSYRPQEFASFHAVPPH
jgi:hypothetical protein